MLDKSYMNFEGENMHNEKIVKDIEKTRNANIELLRIISMFMVLILHCLLTTGALEYGSGIKYYVYWFIEALCVIAVDVFVLISGYFMIEAKFKAKNVFKTAISGVWIYSLIFSILAMKIEGRGSGHSTIELIRAIFPILTKKFWFVNSYVLLYMLSPFLNKLINSLSKKHFTILIGYLVLIFSIRTTLLPLSWSQDPTGGMGISLFILLYSIAAWLRMYYSSNGKKYRWLIGYFTLAICLLMSKVLIIKIGAGENLSSKFYGYSSPVTIVEAICLLLFFINLRPMRNKIGNIINYIAKHSFSVYIIHFAMMSVLFTKIFHVQNWIDRIDTGIMAILVSCVIIYSFCTIIDMIKCLIFNEIGRMMEHCKIKRWYLTFCKKWDSLVSDL